MEHTENTKRIAQNTGFLAFRMLLVVAVGLFTSRIVLDALGIDDYGIYGVVGSVVIFLSFFKNALTNATFRFFTFDLGQGNIERLGQTFSMSLNMHLLLAAVMFIILEICGLIFINNYLNIDPHRLNAANWVFQFSLLAFCIEVIKTPYNSCIIAHERMNFFAYTSLFEVGMGLLNAYLLWLAPMDKLIFYGFLQCMLSLLLLLWYYIYCRRHFSEANYHFIWDTSLLKKLTSYSGWSLLVNAAYIIATQCQNIFLNWFGGVAINAAMGIANQVSSKMNMFLSSFTQAFNPQIIKSYASGDNDYFMKLVLSTAKFSFLILMAMVFPMVIFVDFILNVWLVDVPVYSNIFICLLLIYYLIDALQVSLVQSVHATGKLVVHQILISTIMIASIPVTYILLHCGMPYWTVPAVWAATNLIAAIVRTIYMRSLIGLNIGQYLRDVVGRSLLVCLCSMLLPIYVYSLIGDNWSGLIAVAICFYPLYILSIYALGLNRQEHDMVRTFFNQQLKKIKTT